jgi:hypothetical protein
MSSYFYEIHKGSKCEFLGSYQLGCFIPNAHLFNVDLWCSNDDGCNIDSPNAKQTHDNRIDLSSDVAMVIEGAIILMIDVG